MLIPYFGKFPKWFNLYLYSCSHVKNIDFYYFTDCDIPTKTYSNTIFKSMTFSEYCKLVSEKLNVDFHPKSPYLLCNIRPFLSEIHSDIVKNYIFWGYSDTDLVYGDMSFLLNDYNLNKYDVITTHSERVAGHFTIIKVNSKYDKIGFKIKNWQKKITSDTAGLDEGDFSVIIYPPFPFLGKMWKHIFSKFMPKNEMYYFYQKIHNFYKGKTLFLEGYTTPIPKKDDIWVYDLKDNKIKAPKRFYDKKFLNNKPLPYLHFLFFKKTPYLKTKYYWDNDFYQIPENFDFEDANQILISRNGIILK